MPYVEIVEYHHNQKADAPSGTAIHTAELINSSVSCLKGPVIESKDLFATSSQGVRVGAVKIHSVRLPGFVASQEVILGDSGQTLKIRHDTISRESFIPGVLLAIRGISKCSGLVDGLDKML